MTLDGPHCSCDSMIPEAVGGPCPIHGTIGREHHEILRDEAQRGRVLASAVKQWRHAILGRLRLGSSRESYDNLLDSDRALMEALDTHEGKD